MFPSFLPAVFHLSSLFIRHCLCHFFSFLFSCPPQTHTHAVSCCSCRGRGQLWRGLSQSKDSDWGAIRALHLDPHPGEAVMLRSPRHPSLTATDRYHPSPSQPSQPRLPACLSVLQRSRCFGNHCKWHRETNVNTGSETTRQNGYQNKRHIWAQRCVIELKNMERKGWISIPL